MAFATPQAPPPTRQQHAPSPDHDFPLSPARILPSDCSYSISSSNPTPAESYQPPAFHRHYLLPHLPQAISLFLGYRPPYQTRCAPPIAFAPLWNAFGAFLSILAVAGTMIRLYGFDDATVVGSIVPLPPSPYPTNTLTPVFPRAQPQPCSSSRLPPRLPNHGICSPLNCSPL